MTITRAAKRVGAATAAMTLVLAAFWLGPRLGPALTGLDPADSRTTLADIERTVAASYATAEITTGDLTRTLSDPTTVVFDVREPVEHTHSHIPGARRIDPGITADAFMATYGREIVGKRVVLYCAVGVRSGIAAQRLQRSLIEGGAQTVYNLRGGIFRWHANRGALTSPSGPATTVHPYDDVWGQLLDRTLAPSRATPPALTRQTSAHPS